MKKVYIISNYFHFSQEKESNRYKELAEKLSQEEDVSVEVITSKFYQRTYEFRENFEELTRDIPFKATFVNEVGYNKSVCAKRLISSYVFGKNVIKYIKSQPKPDLIYQVVPTLDVADKVSRYAKKNKIPFVIDVQDLWPEAFKMAFNVPVIRELAFLPLKLKANRIYKRADAVCAVSQTYVDRVLSVNKKCTSGNAVFIGINLAKFDKNVIDEKIEKTNELKLGYCGSLSTSYDIKLVIDALSLLKNAPKFICIGGGNNQQELIDYALSKKVNMQLTGFLPYPKMCALLSSCDMVVNPIVGSSVASIINKHGDYAACGLPVLNTQNSSEYIKLVEDYNMGLNSKSGDKEALANNIKLLMNDVDLRKKMGANARRCAEEKFDRNRTYLKLIDCIKSLLK